MPNPPGYLDESAEAPLLSQPSPGRKALRSGLIEERSVFAAFSASFDLYGELGEQPPTDSAGMPKDNGCTRRHTRGRTTGTESCAARSICSSQHQLAHRSRTRVHASHDDHPGPALRESGQHLPGRYISRRIAPCGVLLQAPARPHLYGPLQPPWAHCARMPGAQPGRRCGGDAAAGSSDRTCARAAVRPLTPRGGTLAWHARLYPASPSGCEHSRPFPRRVRRTDGLGRAAARAVAPRLRLLRVGVQDVRTSRCSPWACAKGRGGGSGGHMLARLASAVFHGSVQKARRHVAALQRCGGAARGVCLGRR